MIPILNNIHLDQDIELKFFIVVKLVEFLNQCQSSKQIYLVVEILEKVNLFKIYSKFIQNLFKIYHF